MSIINQLNAAIEKWNLLNHPFYKAWSDGSLPAAQLKTYSGQYGAFINTIAQSWDTCGYTAIAKTEKSHYTMWQDFAQSLGETSFAATLPAVKTLVEDCNNNNQSVSSALGSLYAFEAQQPYTAQSKIKGLQTHYANLNCDETYFKVHEYDFDEPAILIKDIEALNEAEQKQAILACETTCQNLWNALTDIHGTVPMCN